MKPWCLSKNALALGYLYLSRGDISHIGICPPPPPQRVWFVHCFGLKTGIDFAHFGLESGIVFEGTRRMYEAIKLEAFNKDWIYMDSF